MGLSSSLEVEPATSKARSTAATALAAAWAVAMRTSARSCNEAPPRTAFPSMLSTASISPARPAWNSPSARASAAWADGRSRSRVLLPVGVLRHVTSSAASIAPRAMPSAGAATVAANRVMNGAA